MTGMIDLSHSFCLVTILYEMLWQGDHIRDGLTDMDVISPDFQFIRPQPGQKAGPCGTAERVLTVIPEEYRSLPGEPVEIRGPDVITTIAPEHGPEII